MTGQAQRRGWADRLAQHETWVAGGLVVLAALLRFYDLTGESLWYDETYSVWTSSMDILSPLLLWRWQVEFPLYYWLLHVWMRVWGAGEFSVRAFGACAGALTIWPMYYLGRELGQASGGGRWTGATAALLLAVNPYHVWYSQEVRMYAWAVLATTGSLYAFWRIAQGSRWPWWAAHVLLTGLTFHLHYYIGWMVLAQNLYYLGRLWWSGRGIRSRERRARLGRWLLDQVGVLILALPAFFVFYTKAVGLNQWGWLTERYGPPGPAQVAELLQVYVLGLAFPGPRVARWAVLGLVALVLVLGLWRMIGRVASQATDTGKEGAICRKSAWEGYALAALTTALPLAAVLALGQRSAVWVPRYLLLFLPSLLLWLAMSLAGARRLGLVAMVVLASVGACGLAGMYGAPQKEQWREAAVYVQRQAREQDILVLIDGDCRVPLAYYGAGAMRRIDVSRSANENEAELRQVVEEVTREGGGAAQGRHLWLMVSHASSGNLERALEETPGLTRVEAIEWVGIRLVNYVWS